MVSRRSFLGHGCSVGVTAVTAVSSVATLGFARRAAAQQGFADYKALVCVLLAGGNDSYNMLVPNDDDQYAQYAAIRSDLALEQSDLAAAAGVRHSACTRACPSCRRCMTAATSHSSPTSAR